MTQRHILVRAAAVAAGSVWMLAATASQAQAHPLGNFSVNHYTGLILRPDRIEALTVTDTAEIPTLQDAPHVDTDGDGTASTSERSAWARARCDEAAEHLAVTAAQRLRFTVDSAAFDYQSGQAGMRTSRLECRLSAPADLTAGPVALHVDTGVDATRVGWNEITARGEGVRLDHSTVPATSATDELRSYPRDLLSEPRGDVHAELTAQPGSGSDQGPAAVPPGAQGGPTAWLESLSKRLSALSAVRHLTWPVGVLAVLLSIVLGAGHALLPGHGKTVMAAYLAGRRGRTRDALTVGATVTLTHTAGVLVIGLCLTAFSALAGDLLLNWLGVASGTLVALVGAGLLLDAARRSRRHTAHHHHESAAPPPPAAEPELVGAAATPTATALDATGAPTDRHVLHHHDHPHPQRHHDHHHDHEHDHEHEHDHHHEHVDGQPHDHSPQDGHGHPHGHGHGHGHSHGLFGRHHTHGPADAKPYSNRALVGLGIAGGLVPSPSALVVLLGAVALGRTAFGATLVLAYGLGMAATLTAVGLLLVRIGDQLGTLVDRPGLRTVRRLLPHAALLTALLVLVVGLGLIARSLPLVL
ncbi:high frequency lysogenization protein HflD [Streptomyces tateyamensis]|uniref:High frequency lysogenization protein HflD n=1 Tax=Streptomyces tateyamensis TaxID=565073 RepID=A0A2V4NV94_9ACTN|nr:high frequency lysogenization protein HflD [Streptomyces tateyamensis]PYC70178.1 high frequency lysogenization protein HflD [Streptomyces tateyamensis]